MTAVRLQLPLSIMTSASTMVTDMSEQCFDAVTLQPIRVQSGLHQETAILHVIETEASTAELRGSAMHHRSSKHSLLFSSKGKLLHANKAAMDAYQQGSGESMHLCIVDACVLPACFYVAKMLLNL